MAEVEYCEVADCGRVVEVAGLCAMHRKRLGRGASLTGAVAERGLTPFQRVVEAMVVFLDSPAEDDEQYHANRVRLRAACKRWILNERPRRRQVGQQPRVR